ncbi:MAG: 23S rRNA (guanosine(2251)-2'-O)-methyltransferase RlmB [Bacteroidetes bacterium]|nr:23S rRNA (guanosine(2251)-2'-O)-methyltransferase RlmB [Bacteroidota bacterium]
MKTDYIFGKNAVIEAINSELDIEKIYLCYGIKNDIITKLAKKNKINCTTLDKYKFKKIENDIYIKNSNSQGVIAVKSIIKTFSIHEFLDNINTTNPIVVILDNITDTHNLGAIARSCECAGVDALIMPNNKSAIINPTSIKTSAGALNHIKIIKVNNLINACEKLKENGFWIIGTAIDGKNAHTDKIYDSPIAIIIGSEGKGMSPSLKKHCDHLIKIKMYGKLNSLNASVSTGIILFEIMRQRDLKYV